MAERRKNKKKKEAEIKDIDEKPSKDEYAVAKYLKQKLPEKKTMLMGHKVEYFIACKAVDCLAESPWAKKNKKGDLNFSNRDIASDFMARLLEHKFFHRARKIVVLREPKKPKKKESEDQDSSKESTKIKSDAPKVNKKVDSQEKKDSKKDTENASEKKKEKKKIKLDMHLDQIFIDSNEPYVWIYDPIPLKTWITGTLMVATAVLLCLFPLWPQTIRHYIYYLSVAAAFFLVFIIGLAVLRVVVFVVVWLISLGKHHLWLMPNLLEDVGFFESFWPLYKYEYKGDNKGKEQKNDDDDEIKEVEKEDEDKKEENEYDADKEETADKIEIDENEGDSSDEVPPLEDSSDETQRTDNGFEFVEVEELDGEERKNK